jgi:hypothetical protein
MVARSIQTLDLWSQNDSIMTDVRSKTAWVQVMELKGDFQSCMSSLLAKDSFYIFSSASRTSKRNRRLRMTLLLFK